MRTAGRRRLDVFWIGTSAVVAGGIAALGSAVASPERVERMWVGAQLREDGTATISEVIDYDFGLGQERHGIFRNIPGVPFNATIQVDSPDAPDGIAAQIPTSVGGEQGVQVKIGDPNTTIQGQHRYLLRYDHGGIQAANGSLEWDAVGTGWDVKIEEVEVGVVAPWEFEDLRCAKGSTGDVGGCTIEQPEPGLLRLHVDALGAHEGISIFAGHGRTLEAGAPALPLPPADPPEDEGAGIAQPAAVAALGVLGGGITMSRFVRRRGRERVGVGGVADAAWAGGGGPTSDRLVDAEELAEMATTEFAPPEGITAPMGGIILMERVVDDHKTAWLIEAAIAGHIELDEPKKNKVRLTRLSDGDASTRPILDAMFGGRSEITLGKYDSTFAGGWGKIGTLLESWSGSSQLWDPAGDKRRTRYRVLGVLGIILGVVLVGAGGALSGLFGGSWLGLLVAGAIVLGLSFGAIVRSWELRVRTVTGSAHYLRVESFRRFLHGSEAYHAEEAAKRGLLREYTAWAVAVGEVDRWSKACASASIAPSTAGLGYALMAPHFSSAATSASTAPSSSGGGGGGGSVGGGGGGGGGGSW
ncbi:MAG: DUF2207 domain-containing protein [Actinomycetota bacterium]|nr:DUF2207 domain-containing protein [Actinomycetota bacterium]